MTISISGFSRMPAAAPSRTSSSGSAFVKALADATSSAKTPSADRPEISPAAVVLHEGSSAAGAMVDEASWHRLMQMPEPERRSALVRQADAISQSQGLPPGKYDYRNMSAGQVMVARANLIQNYGYTSEQLAPMLNIALQKPDGGTSADSPIDWTTPRDVLGELTRDHDRLVGTNDVANAKRYQLVMLAMKNTSAIDALDGSLVSTHPEGLQRSSLLP